MNEQIIDLALEIVERVKKDSVFANQARPFPVITTFDGSLIGLEQDIVALNMSLKWDLIDGPEDKMVEIVANQLMQLTQKKAA